MNNMLRTMVASTFCIAFIAACVTMENTVSPVAGTYQNSLIDADATGKTITLHLFADKSCNVQIEKKQGGTKTETGTWESRGRDVTVTLVDPATPSATKTVVFEKRMDQMVSKEWDKKVYGDAGLGTLKKR